MKKRWVLPNSSSTCSWGSIKESVFTKVRWQFYRLTKILSYNVIKWGVLLNRVPSYSSHNSSSVADLRSSIGKKCHPQQIWRHHINFSAYPHRSKLPNNIFILKLLYCKAKHFDCLVLQQPWLVDVLCKWISKSCVLSDVQLTRGW